MGATSSMTPEEVKECWRLYSPWLEQCPIPDHTVQKVSTLDHSGRTSDKIIIEYNIGNKNEDLS